MAYHTTTYLIVFLPLTACIYQLVPRGVRRFVLLFAGYLFYWSISKMLVLFLIGTSLFTHYICAWMTWLRKEGMPEAAEEGAQKDVRTERIRREKKILAFGILVLLGILGYLKYRGFFVLNWNRLSEKTSCLPLLQQTEAMIPIGISFYTLQAIGYMTDVYWKRAEVCRHPGKTALFLGFFPQIMEGPICSYAQTADLLWEGAPIRFHDLSTGSVRILWGLFKKLIIADRLSVLVGAIYGDPSKYSGAQIAVAAVAYTIQLYMEFSGCMDIVIGSGRIFGIPLPENFRQPFFAEDAADFWRRWHMTLGVWFRTYVFYPVSLSRAVKRWMAFTKPRFGKTFAKLGTMAMALFPVWMCNGLWHGPKWSYVFYGMYYFAVLFLTAALEPLRDACLNKMGIRKEAVWYKTARVMKTWVIVFTGELFFRAEGLREGAGMFLSMFRGFSLRQLDREFWFSPGLDKADYLAVIAGCAVVLAVDIMNEKKLLGESGLNGLCMPVRWSIYYGLLFSVILFGAYGIGYNSVDLIYAGF